MPLNVTSDRGARRRDLRKERVKNRIQRRQTRKDERTQRREDRKGLVKPKPSPITHQGPGTGLASPRPTPWNKPKPKPRPKPPQSETDEFLSGDVAGQGTTKDPGFSQQLTKPRPTMMGEEDWNDWNKQYTDRQQWNKEAFDYYDRVKSGEIPKDQVDKRKFMSDAMFRQRRDSPPPGGVEGGYAGYQRWYDDNPRANPSRLPRTAQDILAQKKNIHGGYNR